ncbi:MAG: phosphate acyltransferase, partial [Arenicellales bacterium]
MFLKFRERAGQTHRKVILPEADDIRILLAAKQVDALGIAQPILLGDPDKIKALARANSLDLTGISFLSAKEVASDAVREYLISRKAYRTTSEADIQTALSSPLTLACCLLGMDEVDACVAGAVASTKQVIGQALKIIGMTEEGALLSSFLILTSPVLAQHGLEHILFADCAINIDPDAKQLSQIAIATAQ